jgi:hypothetical protein
MHIAERHDAAERLAQLKAEQEQDLAAVLGELRKPLSA